MSTKEKIINCIKNSKSKNEFNLKYFGYSNKHSYEKLNQWIIKFNVDISHWVKDSKYCLECGKELNSNIKKFCNSSCSAKFNNKKRKLSDETKKKISLSLAGKKKEYCSRYITKKRNCVYCKKTFNVNRIKNGTFSNSKCCSENCRKKHKSVMNKISMERIIKEGRHQGWKTRNIISYPEKIFIKVLKNNNIDYQHNYSILKKDLGVNEPYSYFLDFYISNKNIDLEIDGKQHRYRKEHDKKRDNVLKKNGFNVYRIHWKSINTKKGKLYIENEIKKFLDYYNSI
jgi:very-short-patch-repair endonuclease